MERSERTVRPRSFRPMWACGLLLAAAVMLLVSLAAAHAQDANESFDITLTRQYAQGTLCRLGVSVRGATGTVALGCGIRPGAIGATIAPGTSPEQRQDVSSTDVSRLRRLVADARVFDGGHAGGDLRAVDVFFELLIFRGPTAVALVTTGNPTFATGPRAALLEWLRARERCLTPK